MTSLTLESTGDYRFHVRVEGDAPHEFVTGEGPPLGLPGALEPQELLGAAIGTCLASSLLFCAQKAHVTIQSLSARIDVETVRNAKGRLRIGSIDVALDAGVPEEQGERFARCREIFEDYCTVTESIRAGIPVKVEFASRPTEVR